MKHRSEVYVWIPMDRKRWRTFQHAQTLKGSLDHRNQRQELNTSSSWKESVCHIFVKLCKLCLNWPLLIANGFVVPLKSPVSSACRVYYKKNVRGSWSFVQSPETPFVWSVQKKTLGILQWDRVTQVETLDFLAFKNWIHCVKEVT